MSLVPCRRCKGEGEVPAPDPQGRSWLPCPTCHGRGAMNVPDHRPAPGGKP